MRTERLPLHEIIKHGAILLGFIITADQLLPIVEWVQVESLQLPRYPQRHHNFYRETESLPLHEIIQHGRQ